MPKVDPIYLEERKKYIIACTREVLSEKAWEQVNMRDIIRKTGFSQGTIYNYFKNIDEIFSVLIYQSMCEMKSAIETAATQKSGFQERYHEVCHALAGLYEKNPQLFRAMFREIAYHTTMQEAQDVLFAIYQTGEELNEIVISLLKEGMKEGVIRRDLNLHVTVFYLWSGIGQTILFAYEKQNYIEKQMHMTRQEYMEQGFALIMRSIIKETI